MNKILLTIIFGILITLANASAVSEAEKTNEGIIMAGVILSVFGISIFFLYFSLNINSVPFQIFFLALAFIFLIGTVGMGIITVRDLVETGGIYSTISTLFYVLLAVFFIFMTFIMINLTVKSLDLYKIKRGLK